MVGLPRLLDEEADSKKPIDYVHYDRSPQPCHPPPVPFCENYVQQNPRSVHTQKVSPPQPTPRPLIRNLKLTRTNITLYKTIVSAIYIKVSPRPSILPEKIETRGTGRGCLRQVVRQVRSNRHLSLLCSKKAPSRCRRIMLLTCSCKNEWLNRSRACVLLQSAKPSDQSKTRTQDNSGVHALRTCLTVSTMTTAAAVALVPATGV